MENLRGRRLLMFVEELYEDLELWYPKLRMIEAGAGIVVAAPEAGRIYRGKNGYPCRADVALADVQAEEYAGLIIPGGFAPDKLRRDETVLRLTREIHDAGKLVAHICHAGWIPISAGIMRGYRCTSTPGIKDDLVNAGATWVDEPLVVDRMMVSSRRPDDLPDFCRGILRLLKG
jgi:protease I